MLLKTKEWEHSLRRGGEKNIKANIAFRKIKKYFPKDHLVFFYGQFDLAKILKSAEAVETMTETQFPAFFSASLKATLNLPFLKRKVAEESEEVAVAFAIIAERNELRTESYSLDLREDAFVPSSFALKDSLSSLLPEKIGGNSIFFYGEGRDLRSQLEFLEKENLKSATAEEKKQYDEILSSLNQSLGIDLKENILSWMDKNYAFFLASDPTGKEMPSLAFIFEIEGEKEVKEKLLEIKIQPLSLVPLGSPYPPEILPPQEQIPFSKETIVGFEIYSLPFFQEFGLNFSIKEEKLILALTKEGLVNILKSLSDTRQKRLKDADLFTDHFKKIPKEIASISYSYPYGSLGALKWTTSFVLDAYLQGIGRPLGLGVEDFEAEKSKAAFFEFLDRGVAPYLKVLKSYGDYSYSPENGLIVSKGRLLIAQLSSEEKKTTEEFWTNIQKWFEENFGHLLPIPPVTGSILPSGLALCNYQTAEECKEDIKCYLRNILDVATQPFYLCCPQDENSIPKKHACLAPFP